jgi:outer membrane protein assembly factor BamA
MFLPILSYADGYGFTYGARFTWNDLLGLGERISTPLTWGGTRRAGVEIERTFKRGPLTRVFSSASIYQRDNPGFFESEDERGVDDRRLELRGRAERHFAHVLFTGVEATRAQVDFGDSPTVHQWTFGADAAIDTRGDPAFPGNAVYLFGGWNGLNLRESDRINRYTVDGRGYLRLFGQPVLAARALYQRADAPLPLHERWLIGGSSTLRGRRTGEFNGDKTLATSVELRVPITSVISGAKLGLNVFYDAAKVTDFGLRLEDAAWDRSAGAGVFLIAAIVKLNLDVAKAFDGGTRVHFGTGFSF